MNHRELGFEPFDADNHYYEAVDAFTRHVAPAMQPRVVQWVEQNGRRYHLVGGTISHAVVNPTWDPIAKPGALHEYFKGNPEGRSPLEMLKDREPLPRHYLDPEARSDVMSRQGLQGVWLFPTLGVLYEELIKTDIQAVVAMMQGFNRWLEEDWGFNHRDRIFGAPYISLADVGAAAAEVDRVVAAGARVLVMRPAAVTTETGVASPFDTRFEPVWARINEAGITVVIHAGDSGYSSNGYAEDSFFCQRYRRQARTEPQGIRDRACRARLVDPVGVREDLSAGSPTFVSPPSKTGPTSWRRCSANSPRPRRSRSGGSTKTPSTRFGDTFG